MVKHKANAKFLIGLAQKGRSLVPHMPHRYSDMVGLFWAVYRELISHDAQAVLFRKRSICKANVWGWSISPDPMNIFIAGFFPGSIFDNEKGFALTVINPPGHDLLPIARWRLYTCFLPIADDLGVVEQWNDRVIKSSSAGRR